MFIVALFTIAKTCKQPKCPSTDEQIRKMWYIYTMECYLDRWNFSADCERLLLNHANTPGFLAPGGEEFNPGPETRLDRSELLCNKVLLKYKGDRESF